MAQQQQTMHTQAEVNRLQQQQEQIFKASLA
jgi:hypothetical protein